MICLFGFLCQAQENFRDKANVRADGGRLAGRSI
jgi:hypothetical protein